LHKDISVFAVDKIRLLVGIQHLNVRKCNPRDCFINVWIASNKFTCWL